MAYITVAKENSTDIELFYEDHGSGSPVILNPWVSAEWSFVGKTAPRLIACRLSRHHL